MRALIKYGFQKRDSLRSWYLAESARAMPVLKLRNTSCGIVGTTTSHVRFCHSSTLRAHVPTSWFCAVVLAVALFLPLLLMGGLAFSQTIISSEPEQAGVVASLRAIVVGHPIIGQPTKVILAAVGGTGNVIKDYDGVVKISANTSVIIPGRVDFSKKQFAVKKVGGVKSIPVTFTESGIVYVSAVTQIGSRKLEANTPVRVRQSNNDEHSVFWGKVVEETFGDGDENLSRDEFMRHSRDELGLAFVIFGDGELVALDAKKIEEITSSDALFPIALALPDGVPSAMMNSDKKMPYTFRGGLVAVESGNWYTTTGARILLEFEITRDDDKREGRLHSEVKIRAQVYGTAPLIRLDIYRRDPRKSRRKKKFIDTLVFTNSPGVMSTEITFTENVSSRDSFYWIRAVQADGHIASTVLPLPVFK